MVGGRTSNCLAAVPCPTWNHAQCGTLLTGVDIFSTLPCMINPEAEDAVIMTVGQIQQAV